MPATRAPQLKVRRSSTGHLRALAAPDRAPVIAQAGTALARLTDRVDRRGETPLDVQLVVDVCGAAGYARWRADRETVWSAQGGRYGTGAWPAALDPRGFAAVLLPLALDGVHAARTARVVAEPWFTSASGADGRRPADVAVSMIADWLHDAASSRALRLAPPVLLTGAGRETLDLGLRWSLQPAD